MLKKITLLVSCLLSFLIQLSAQTDSADCVYAYCKTDKFTGETNCFSKIYDGISFMKQKRGKKETIYINVSVFGYSLTVDAKGAWIMLSNGKIISRPNAKVDIDVTSSGSGYNYRAFFKLSKNEIELLKGLEITDVKVYIFDNSTDYADQVLESLSCLLKK